MGTGKKYDEEYKSNAIKLAKEVGVKQTIQELAIPEGTLRGWIRKSRAGEIDTGSGSRTTEESLNLAQQLQAERKRIKELEKENKRLRELNEFLEEASTFFAASRQKLGKRNE